MQKILRDYKLGGSNIMALNNVGSRVYSKLKPKVGPALASDWALYIQKLGDGSKLETMLNVLMDLLPDLAPEVVQNFSDREEGKKHTEAKEAVNKYFGSHDVKPSMTYSNEAEQKDAAFAASNRWFGVPIPDRVSEEERLEFSDSEKEERKQQGRKAANKFFGVS